MAAVGGHRRHGRGLPGLRHAGGRRQRQPLQRVARPRHRPDAGRRHARAWSTPSSGGRPGGGSSRGDGCWCSAPMAPAQPGRVALGVGSGRRRAARSPALDLPRGRGPGRARAAARGRRPAAAACTTWPTAAWRWPWPRWSRASGVGVELTAADGPPRAVRRVAGPRGRLRRARPRVEAVLAPGRGRRRRGARGRRGGRRPPAPRTAGRRGRGRRGGAWRGRLPSAFGTAVTH